MVKIETLRDLESRLDAFPVIIDYDTLGKDGSDGVVMIDGKPEKVYERFANIRDFFKKNADRKLDDITIGVNSLGLTLGITFESED